MRKAGFILLVLLSFLVTMTVSAEDFKFSNLFEYSVFMETTIIDGGVIDQIMVGESVAVLSAESILPCSFQDILLLTWTGNVGEYIVNDQMKWFTHPAVLGIA